MFYRQRKRMSYCRLFCVSPAKYTRAQVKVLLAILEKAKQLGWLGTVFLFLCWGGSALGIEVKNKLAGTVMCGGGGIPHGNWR